MTTLTKAFEAECRRKVGHTHTLAMPAHEPTYDDFVAVFPPTTAGRVEAAQAAGYGTARSVRGNREKTRRGADGALGTRDRRAPGAPRRRPGVAGVTSSCAVNQSTGTAFKPCRRTISRMARSMPSRSAALK